MNECCCGKCNWCILDESGEWSCNNENSEYYGLQTEYSQTCEEYEEY